MEEDSLKTAEEKIAEYINTKAKVDQIDKKLKSYPKKVRQIIMNELKKTEILELDNLYDKLSYIIKVIENSGQIVVENDEIPDYLDANKEKMMYNVSVQTDNEVVEMGTNTVEKKMQSSYTLT